MADATDKKALFLQNLEDAGCDGQMIRECLSLAGTRQETQLLQLLARRKRALLELVHQNQEQIDCLDFLVYQIKHGHVI